MLPAILCTWLALSPGGRTLWVAQEDPRRLVSVDTGGRAGRAIPLPFVPTGLAAAGGGLYVTGEGGVRAVDPAGRIRTLLATGRGATSPVFSPDGRFLYVCNRFDNTVSAVDAGGWRVLETVPVCREPVAAALASGGKRLLVACHLPDDPLTSEHVGAKVSIIDTGALAVERTLALPNGSTGVRGVAVSGDGRYAFLTHILARYTLHTSQLEQGWMNTNALTVVDVAARRLLNTVLLDDVDNGAANPWAVACTSDSRYLCATHAGTHELSLVCLPELLNKLRSETGEPANQLSYLSGLRRRIPLPGKGPRAVVIAGNDVWVGERFSGTLARVRLEGAPSAVSIPLAGMAAMSDARRGEMLFHDARFCFQRWQSCASCHPDGRADALNWDLLNDGIGNPKNTRSLLNSWRSGAVMWTGVRPGADYAVRSGLRHILFAEPLETETAALEAYLHSLTPVRGSVDAGAVSRGEKLFFSPAVGCAACHPPPLFSDNRKHDVGTHGQLDFTEDESGKRAAQREYKTPSLVEVWRTAPYLHDGRFRTLEQTIGPGNSAGRRGRTAHLSPDALRDLAAFVASL